MSASWQNVSDNSVKLIGKLSQSTVTSLLPIKKQLQTYNSELNVDLSQLTKVDSAGLAYLLELKEIAEKKAIVVRFKGATVALSKLIALYNAEPLLKN